ncbi:MAG: hypothetical protein JNK56_13230 [Myxococcales bacterium]|nr:hypothetical protein [Myxococcales bacterium]
MTLGVTIGMFTTDSPQSFGSKVVLPPVGSDDMLASVGVVPAVVPSVALALAVPSVALAVSVADADAVIVIEFDDIVLEFDSEFDSSPLPLPLSPHAAARRDIKDSKHALRFISW